MTEASALSDQSVKDALAAYDKRMQEIGACGDGYCLVTGKAKGMHTNGGCRCWSNKYTAQRVMGAARALRDAVANSVSDPT